MTSRMVALLLTVKIRDGMTMTLLAIAATLLICGALIQRAPYPERMKRIMVNTYAGLCLSAWVIWLLVLATTRGL